MPGDDAPMVRRLYEEVIVPKPHGAAQQSRRRDEHGRMPQQIMKRRGNPPRAQRVKEHSVWMSRLVRMEFVKEIVAGMILIDQFREVATQCVDLFVIEHSDACEISLLVEEFDLIIGEAVFFPVVERWKKIS